MASRRAANAAAFLGRADYEELLAAPEALRMVLHYNDDSGWTPAQSQEYVRSLHKAGDATANLFQCLHCGQHLAYTDMA
jgi:uncharacterized protein CbrC (UPF0167 family)